MSFGLEVDEPFSPGMLKKVVYAGANCRSFVYAERDLSELAEQAVPLWQIERTTEKIGAERVAQRNEQTAEWEQKPLVEKCPQPHPKASDVAVVQCDGGRMLVFDRQAEEAKETVAGTAACDSEGVSDSPPSIEPAAGCPCEGDAGDTPADSMTAATSQELSEDHQQDCDADRKTNWREPKVGSLYWMESEVNSEDPCPEVPAVFLDPPKMSKLVSELGRQKASGAAGQPEETPTSTENHPSEPPGAAELPLGDLERAEPVASVSQSGDQQISPSSESSSQGALSKEPADNSEKKKSKRRPGAPELSSRPLVVATLAGSLLFSKMLAAAALAEGLAEAGRKAFVGDGGSWIWKLQRLLFPRWTPILDFVHALSYVYAGAMAGRTASEGWAIYVRWITWVWKGDVEQVIAELATRQAELGRPQKDEAENSPRSIVQSCLVFLQNNKDRMRYDDYRKQGLPIVSCYIESTIKQINQRMKGTEKTWSPAGGESVLQLRADYLSDSEPMVRFWRDREAQATGQRRRAPRRAAQTAS